MKLLILYAISTAIAVTAVMLVSWFADAIKKMFGEE